MVTAAIPAKVQTVPAPRAREKFAVKGRLTVPALFAALCFTAGVLLAHFSWYLPGLLLVSLSGSFAIAAAVIRWAPR